MSDFNRLSEFSDEELLVMGVALRAMRKTGIGWDSEAENLLSEIETEETERQAGYMAEDEEEPRA